MVDPAGAGHPAVSAVDPRRGHASFRMSSQYEIKTMTLFVDVLQRQGFVEPFRHTGEDHPPFGMNWIETLGQARVSRAPLYLPQQGRALI